MPFAILIVGMICIMFVGLISSMSPSQKQIAIDKGEIINSVEDWGEAIPGCNLKYYNTYAHASFWLVRCDGKNTSATSYDTGGKSPARGPVITVE
jgi:hypothetical protein